MADTKNSSFGLHTLSFGFHSDSLQLLISVSLSLSLSLYFTAALCFSLAFSFLVSLSLLLFLSCVFALVVSCLARANKHVRSNA